MSTHLRILNENSFDNILDCCLKDLINAIGVDKQGKMSLTAKIIYARAYIIVDALARPTLACQKYCFENCLENSTVHVYRLIIDVVVSNLEVLFVLREYLHTCIIDMYPYRHCTGIYCCCLLHWKCHKE